MASKNLKDFFYVAGGQLISMSISIVRSLILPLYLSVLNFGYFQSYLFYISLLPLIAIGYNDGVYLRYGKYNYENLPFKLLSSSNLIYILNLCLLSAGVFSISLFFIKDQAVRYVLLLSCSYGVINGLNSLIMQIYQITRKFSDYTNITILSRTCSLIVILALIFSGYTGYKGIILADLIVFVGVTLFVILKNKALFSLNVIDINGGWEEYKKCVIAGFPLLIAGLIGVLYMGGGRLIVQVIGGIEKFSVYSFSLSVASFVSIAISSLSTVVYPMISRYNTDQLQLTFTKMNRYLRLSIIAIIPMYALASIAIKYIYPKYLETLDYLSVVFAMTYLQAFIYVLQNTYYKSLRIERKLLLDNVISIAFLIIVGFPLYYFSESVLGIAIVTFLALMCRYLLSCIRLKNVLKVSKIFNFFEIVYLLIFILLTTVVDSLYFKSVSLSCLLIIYLYLNKNNILEIIKR